MSGEEEMDALQRERSAELAEAIQRFAKAARTCALAMGLAEARWKHQREARKAAQLDTTDAQETGK